MARRAEQPWWEKAAELMVAEGKSLPAAVAELELEGIELQDALAIERSKPFRKVLRDVRSRFYLELAKDPLYGKARVVGKLIHLADKLTEAAEHDKAADVLFKLAKVEGWLAPDAQVNVIGNLTQRDLDNLKKELEGSKHSGTEGSASSIRQLD